MASNQYLPFATGGGANVETPANWAADTTRPGGFVGGTASSTKFNTALRQASEVAAMVGQFIVDTVAQNANDDGNIAALEASFIAAVQKQALNVVGTALVYWGGTDTGTQNNIVTTVTPSVTALQPGMLFIFRPAFNNTGAVTLNVSGLGVKNVVNTNATPLTAGEMLASGVSIAVWDGTNFELLYSALGSGSLTALPGTMSFVTGSQQINQNDLLLIGGPGDEAYTAKTIDYAVLGPAQTIRAATQVVNGSATGSRRQAAATDNLANIYICAPNIWGALTVTKYSPIGGYLGTATLDASTTAVYSPKLVQLSNDTFACVYAGTSGALKFVVFDTALSIIAGPTSVATEYNVGSVVFHDTTALAAGGFAIVFQTSAGTAVNLATYSNVGASVLAATSVQTLSSTVAQVYVSVNQLANANLLITMRGTMTPAGSTFVVVTTGGVSVVTNTVVDSTSVAGFNFVNVMSNGYFAVAVPNGTNMKCGVYSSLGVLQGSAYTTACTLNTTGYMAAKLVNDGVQFWLAFVGTASNGLVVAQIPTTGTNYATTSGINSTFISGTGFSFDAEFNNGLLICFAASTGAGGQQWFSVGLPDTFVGTSVPYLRSSGNIGVAATAGSLWPRILSNGDWTATFVYEAQTTAATFFATQGVESSAIVGIAKSIVNVGNTGSTVVVAPGPGQTSCTALAGTPGLSFNHLNTAPVGNIGVLYTDAVAFGQSIIGTVGGSQASTITLTANNYSPISAKDPVQINNDGTIYTAKVTDYAAVANGAAAATVGSVTGVIVPFTQMSTTPAPNGGVGRYPVVVLSDGSYLAACGNASVDLSRYTSAGTFISNTTIFATGAAKFTSMVTLSSGNVAVVWSYAPAAVSHYFAIFNPYTNTVVVPATLVSGDTVTGVPTLTALPSGGFAVTYNNNVPQYRLTVINNSGSVTVAPLTIASTTVTYFNAAVLSNGNILTAYTTGSGMTIAIYSAAGSVVLASTVIHATATYIIPDIAVMSGYFAVGCGEGSNTAVPTTAHLLIFNNAGTQQGSTYSGTSVTQGTPFNSRYRVFSDGVQFWMAYIETAAVLVKAPVSGQGYQRFNLPYSGITGMVGGAIDGFYENGRIVFAGVTNTSTSYSFYAWWMFNTVTSTWEITAAQSPFGYTGGASNVYSIGPISLIPTGDFSMAVFANTQVSATTGASFMVLKYSNTAFFGIAQNAAPPGGNVTIAYQIGGVCNRMIGTASKNFNHTATNIPGNSGSLLTTSAILGGTI